MDTPVFHKIITFTCPDKAGILAHITQEIATQGGNLIEVDQFSTEGEGAQFFLRVLVNFEVDPLGLDSSLETAFAPYKGVLKVVSDSEKLKMGILVSKPSHCLRDILYRWKSGLLNVEIPYIISNHPDHQAYADFYGIPYEYLPVTDKAMQEQELLLRLKESTDFLVMARYMQILSPSFLNAYAKDIINIHHSFLPAFIGANPYKQAFEKGVKMIGATSHFATEDLDEGNIISQEVMPVTHRHSVSTLKQIGEDVERLALWKALKAYTEHRVFKHNQRTIILGA